MILAIDNADAQLLLDMTLSMSALEEAYRDLGTGASITSPRIDLLTPDSYVDDDGNTLPGAHNLKTMSASTREVRHHSVPHGQAVLGRRAMATFAANRTPGTQRAHSVTRGLLFLFSVENGNLLALISEGHIRNLRVGAAAGLAARYLAKTGASTVGLLGTGFMAGAHLDAMLTGVDGIKSVRVFSPNPAHRERFVEDPRWESCPDVVAVDSAEEAVRGSDIVVIATNALTPVIRPAGWNRGNTSARCATARSRRKPSPASTFSRSTPRTIWGRRPSSPRTPRGRCRQQVLLDIDKGLSARQRGEHRLAQHSRSAGPPAESSPGPDGP